MMSFSMGATNQRRCKPRRKGFEPEPLHIPVAPPDELGERIPVVDEDKPGTHVVVIDIS
jgi:hypothetical protein